MGDDYISYLCGCSPNERINLGCHAGNKCWLKEAILSSVENLECEGNVCMLLKEELQQCLGGSFAVPNLSSLVYYIIDWESGGG